MFIMGVLISTKHTDDLIKRCCMYNLFTFRYVVPPMQASLISKSYNVNKIVFTIYLCTCKRCIHLQIATCHLASFHCFHDLYKVGLHSHLQMFRICCGWTHQYEHHVHCLPRLCVLHKIVWNMIRWFIIILKWLWRLISI